MKNKSQQFKTSEYGYSKKEFALSIGHVKGEKSTGGFTDGHSLETPP